MKNNPWVNIGQDSILGREISNMDVVVSWVAEGAEWLEGKDMGGAMTHHFESWGLGTLSCGFQPKNHGYLLDAETL